MIRLRDLRPNGGRSRPSLPPVLAALRFCNRRLWPIMLTALLGVTFAPAIGVQGSALAADAASGAEESIGERPPDDLLKPEAIQEGRHTFFVYCSSCHGTDGWGGPCPNLADEVTLHGGRYADMLATITRGVEGSEMPRWFGKLEFERIMHVAAYVYSLKGTRIPKTADGRQVSARRRATLYTPPPPGEAAKPFAAPREPVER